jgi:hypothetical protein
MQVTPLAGDPDIYISATVAEPTMSQSTWSRAHLGGDTITIGADDPAACGGSHAPNPCTYHIGIFGYAGRCASYAASALGAQQGPT